MLSVLPIPALQDNYIWVLHDSSNAVIVDPGQAAPILAWLRTQGMHLGAILVTHHHGDHVGGVAELASIHGCPVYGPADEAIPARTHAVSDGDRVVLDAPAATFEVLGVPGHTRGHVAYLGHGHLFCGDTLFSCGCGRIFEGTAAQLYASLMKLAALPDDTLVCCAHEYTLANIAFAQEVDPDNAALKAWAREARALRRAGLPTLPVSLHQERLTNPFLRCDQEPLRDAVKEGLNDPLAGPEKVFAVLREMKNRF